MKLVVRGQEITVGFVADTQILPLAKVLGAAGLKAPEENSPHYERWKAETTNAFMQPENQAVVAYTLTSLFPEIAPAIARYKIKRYDEGYSEIDFHLAINIDELFEIVETLAPLIQKRADTLKESKAPKGFAPKSQPSAKPVDAQQRIKEIQAELAELQAS
jgi:hypothetical protein